METRELFERLVSDEPPLTLSVSHALESGRRAQRSRSAAAMAAAAAAVVLVAGGAVETQRHQVSATSGEGAALGSSPATPTASQTPPLDVTGSLDATSLPFLSAGQVSVAAARVNDLLDHVAAGQGPAAGQAPTVVPPAGDPPSHVEALAYWTSPSTTVFARVTVSTPADASHVYGKAVTAGPCAGPIPNRSAATDCGSASLRGGGTLWTWNVRQPHQPNGGIVTSATPSDLMQRDALIVAADGSALEVMHWAELSHEGGDVALPSETSLSDSAVVSLAERGLVAWTTVSGSALPAASAATGAVASMEAMPSLGGPGVSSLPFTNPVQITASNAAVYAKLVAAAGGKDKLLKGWPTWDSAPVSTKTVFLGTQVQWAVGADSAYLQVTTKTAAEATKEYGSLLKSGPCGSGLGEPLGTAVRCLDTPLPGGARAWTWEDDGSGPGAKGGTTSASSKSVMGRSVIVVAKDGSTLTLNESAQRGHEVGGGTPVALPNAMPDSAALFTLAAQLAQAWQSAAR